MAPNTPLVRELVADPQVKVVRESTYNYLENLAPSFRASILSRYAGTTLGRREMEAELLLDVEGALWTFGNLVQHRVADSPPDLIRVVVGVDSAGGGKDETGIVVVARGRDGHGYLLADRSGRFHPDEWAQRAVGAYHEFNADGLVAERNYGGEMVGHTIATVGSGVPVKMVTATRGTAIRAGPIAAMYEQVRVHHVGRLEAQLCGWTEDAGHSPDRLDALVWALTDVIDQSSAAAYLAQLGEQAEARQGLTTQQAQALLLRGFGLQRPGG